jgi:F0F1-type ATP synthase membrane subunit c/vacuolar-type H+-ATPase subunit K
MLNPEDREKIQTVIRTHWFIWLSFAAAIVMYTFVVFIVTQSRSGEPPELGILRTIFIVISLVLGAVKFWLQRGLLFEETAYRQCGTIDEIIAKYAGRYFIILAVCEAPALLGLVIAFLTGRLEDWWLFFLISAALFATSTPQHARLETIAQAHAARTSAQ